MGRVLRPRGPRTVERARGPPPGTDSALGGYYSAEHQRAWGPEALKRRPLEHFTLFASRPVPLIYPPTLVDTQVRLQMFGAAK